MIRRFVGLNATRAGAVFVLLCAAAISVVASAAAGSRSAGSSPPEAVAALARLKAASGGRAWDRVTSIHTSMRIEAGGLEGTAESWEETRTGRHVDRFELGAMTGAQGWDGTAGWSQDPSGQSKPMEGTDEVQAVVNEAFRRSLAYWYPERWTAVLEYAGVESKMDREFEVVRLIPKGGRPFEFWIDSKTHLLNHVVEASAHETRTTYLTDYRRVDGRMVAFAMRSTSGEEKYDQHTRLESVEFNAVLDRAIFAMPAPPAPDYEFDRGVVSTQIPFTLVNNHIYLDVMLNGKGPYRFLCDTGGANVVSPTVAAELGVESEGTFEARGAGEQSEDVGFTRIDSLRAGGVLLKDQTFAVLALESFGDIEGVSMDGLVGYEVFKRFIVRVDYEHGHLTLWKPSAYHYEGPGIVVPFTFNGRMPQVEGSIDGVAGRFDIDTGSRSSLTLSSPFVEKHDLRSKLKPRWETVTGWGVGGPVRGAVARADELRLGPVAVTAPVTVLSLQERGALADPNIAGNVGAGVLKRFNIVFDYGNKRMIFEPNARMSEPDVYDRSGMWIHRAGSTIKVIEVTQEGPAAKAGIKAGESIVEVDGIPVIPETLVRLRDRLRTEVAGTQIRLTIESDGVRREVTLVLQDLV